MYIFFYSYANLKLKEALFSCILYCIILLYFTNEFKKKKIKKNKEFENKFEL